MSTEALTMRKTAQELGISQLRVRELIKKGRLSAEKVSDDSGEHWEISRTSIEAFRKERDNNSEGASSATPPRSGGTDAPAGADLATLLPELERQLERVKGLAQEVSRAQAYLDGLRKAERRLEDEITSVRRRMKEKPRRADEGDGQTPSGAEDREAAAPKGTSAPPKAEPPKAEQAEGTIPAPAPAESGKKGDRRPRKGETNIGAALRDAGIDEKGPKSEGEAPPKDGETSDG